jgi:outer membrane immunogenic protein
VRADVVRAATVDFSRQAFDDFGNPVGLPVPFLESRTDSKLSGYYWAYSAGIGVDIEFMPRVFARLEYEALHIPDIQQMKVSIQTVRTGVGLKF